MNLPDNASIVFFDDQYHPKMKQDNIHYVHLYPYARSIKFLDMIKRFTKANNNGHFGKSFKFAPSLSDTQFTTTMYKILEKLGRQHITYQVTKTKTSKKDIEETNRIKLAIKHFIGKKSRKKKRRTVKRKTRKK
jgi:hypothetical protein